MVPYDVFTNAFLGKMTDYGLGQMTLSVRTSVVDQYMKLSMTRFNKVCKASGYDLAERDDAIRALLLDIPDADLYEIVDIVSDGMVEQWSKPYKYNSDNFQNILNTADYKQASPSELVFRIAQIHDDARKNFSQRIIQYSYDHGDLTELHL